MMKAIKHFTIYVDDFLQLLKNALLEENNNNNDNNDNKNCPNFHPINF